MDNYILKDGTLYHYGILGQKHGNRRYQYEDGSLTPLGRIHYGVGKIKYKIKYNQKKKQIEKEQKKAAEEQKKAEEAAKKAEEQKKNKRIEDMTNEELVEFIARKTAEKNAYQLKTDIARLNPQKQSAVKSIVKKFLNDAILPAAVNAGKDYLEKALKAAGQKALNENKPPESKESAAKKESDYWNNLKNIEVNKAQYNVNKAKNDQYATTKDVTIYQNDKKKNKN